MPAIMQSHVIGFQAQYTDQAGTLKAARIIGLGELTNGWARTATLDFGHGSSISGVVHNDDPTAVGTFRWPGGIDPAYGFARQVDDGDPTEGVAGGVRPGNK